MAAPEYSSSGSNALGSFRGVQDGLPKNPPGVTMSGFGFAGNDGSASARFLTPSVHGPFTQSLTKGGLVQEKLQVASLAESDFSLQAQLISIIECLSSELAELKTAFHATQMDVEFLMGATPSWVQPAGTYSRVRSSVTLQKKESDSVISYRLISQSGQMVQGSGPWYDYIDVQGPIVKGGVVQLDESGNTTCYGGGFNDVNCDGATSANAAVPSVNGIPNLAHIFMVWSDEELSIEGWAINNLTIPYKSESASGNAEVIIKDHRSMTTTVGAVDDMLKIPAGTGVVMTQCEVKVGVDTVARGHLVAKSRNFREYRSVTLDAMEGACGVFIYQSSNDRPMYLSVLYVEFCPSSYTSKIGARNWGSLTFSPWMGTATTFVNPRAMAVTTTGVDVKAKSSHAISVLNDRRIIGKFLRTFKRVTSAGMKLTDIVISGSTALGAVASILSVFPPTAELAIPSVVLAKTAGLAINAKAALSKIDTILTDYESNGYANPNPNSRDVGTISSVIADTTMPLLFAVSPFLAEDTKLDPSRLLARATT